MKEGQQYQWAVAGSGGRGPRATIEYATFHQHIPFISFLSLSLHFLSTRSFTCGVRRWTVGKSISTYLKVDYACYYSIERNLLNFQKYNSDL